MTGEFIYYQHENGRLYRLSTTWFEPGGDVRQEVRYPGDPKWYPTWDLVEKLFFSLDPYLDRLDVDDEPPLG